MRTAAVAALALAAAALSACGGSSPSVVRPPATTPPVTTPVTTSPAPGGSAQSSTAVVHPALTVTPSRGLHDGQRVSVRATGFSPEEALQVIECAAKGEATGPGDCNLTGMLSATSDANGRVDLTLTVARGPFGANKIVCSARQKCLVSVTQASLSPTEEADADIAFAVPG